MHVHMRRADWIVLLILSVLWGGSFFFIGIALRSMTLLTLVQLRVGLAAVLLWTWRIARGERLGVPMTVIPPLFLLALLNNVLPFMLFAWAQRTIPSGLTAILNATTPIWGVIVAHLSTSDEKATPGKIGGVILGFAGVAVMIGTSLFGRLGHDVVAELACLAATLSYAFAGVYGRRFRTLGIPPLAVATGQLTAAAVVMLPLVLLFEPPTHMTAPTLQAWVALGCLALFCTAFAYILFFRLLASAGATNALLVTFLIPITAILLGTFVLGERLAPRQIAGMALIGLGLIAIDGRLLRRFVLRDAGAEPSLGRPSAPS